MCTKLWAALLLHTEQCGQGRAGGMHYLQRESEREGAKARERVRAREREREGERARESERDRERVRE